MVKHLLQPGPIANAVANRRYKNEPRPDPSRTQPVPVPNREDSASLHPPPLAATEFLLRTRDSDFANDAAIARKARRIALTATEQIDQLSLVGYQSLEPAYAAVVETVIFYAAREAMES